MGKASNRKRQRAEVQAAMPESMAVRKISVRGEDRYELVLGAVQDMPPGNRPPTMRYLFTPDQFDEILTALLAVRDQIAEPIGAPSSPLQ